MQLSYLLAAGKIIRDEIAKKYSYIDVFAGVVIPKGQESGLIFVINRQQLKGGKSARLFLPPKRSGILNLIILD